MNILILNWRDVRHPKSGGAELVTMEHATAWTAAGHCVTWLTAGYAGAKKEELFHGIRILRRAGSLTIYLYVPWYLLRYGHTYDLVIDEVHGFPFFSPLVTRKPVIVFIHEIAGEIWDFMFPFPKNVIGKFLEQSYFHLYRHCLFWTDAPSTMSELESHGVARTQCIAIPCPIPPGYQRYARTSAKKERRSTYIFVSRVVRMKGIEEVIKAFSFIARAQKDAVLWIVGGGEADYITELRSMTRDYGVADRIQFFGILTEKEKYNRMARACLLLHASVKEGWGLVVLEAAAVGTPAVVYNVAGLKDVVKDGKTGIVILNNSPQEMAREAMRLVHDPERYHTLQRNGKKWVRSLEWSDVTKQSLELLQKAVTR